MIFWMTEEQHVAYSAYVRALTEFAAHYQYRALPPVPAEKLRRVLSTQRNAVEVIRADQQ